MDIKAVEVEPADVGQTVRLSLVNETGKVAVFDFQGNVSTTVYSHAGGVTLTVHVSSRVEPPSELPLMPNANRR